jgi:translation initiation factor eIF-2B subunit alpha
MQTAPSKQKADTILSDLRRHLSHGKPQTTSSSAVNIGDGVCVSTDLTAVAIPVAATQALLDVIRRSTANTMMGLQMELEEASHIMLTHAETKSLLGGRSTIALASGCELFLKHVTRAFLELPDFAACKAQVLERGERFASISLAARERIADLGQAFVQDGTVVLTHGWSRVVTKLLVKASKERQKHFEIIVLEGRPDAGGAKAAKAFYEEANIPVTVVLDSAMGYVMERVDMVLVGAEGVVENGGIVNKVGTYALGITARELGKPLYVAAESYKFARLFPLNQRDLPDRAMGGGTKLNFVDTACWEATAGAVGNKAILADVETTVKDGELNIPGLVKLPPQVKVENPTCDYTPAKYITLLFTDLGVLTPSAVSDELISLYQ